MKFFRSHTKFTLLLAKDIATFIAYPLAMWLSTFVLRGYAQSSRKLLIALAFGLPLGLLHRYADKRIQQLPDSLTDRQRRLHALVTAVGYVCWIVGILCVAVFIRERSVWALTCLVVPVLGVFGFTVVRGNLGLDPFMRAKPSKRSDEFS